MKSFLFLVFLLAVAVVSSAPATVVAQEENWITAVSIVDFNSGTDFTNRPLLAGGVYNFTFTVNVPFDAADTVVMSTQLSQVGAQYWFLMGDYSGLDPSQWTPGRPSVSFSQAKGLATFSLLGRVPSTVTTRNATDSNTSIMLHFIDENYTAVVLTVSSSGAIVGSVDVTIVDQAISAYQSELDAKEQLAETADIDPSYGSLLTSVLDQAHQLYENGLVEEALSVLRSIPEEVPLAPKPSDGSQLTLFISIIVPLAAVAGLTAFVAVRARSRLTLLKNLMEDEANKLDLSLVRLRRTDQSLASDIEGVRDRMKELSS